MFAVALAAAWLLMWPSAMLAQQTVAQQSAPTWLCSYFPNLPGCGGGTPPRCNYFPNLPVCRVHSTPEIDAAHGLAAVAAVLAGLALVRERRLVAGWVTGPAEGRDHQRS
jgi:hypothetical protein